MSHSFCLISLAKNMLEGWNIFHLKCGIHRSVWSIKTFLYDIWGPRYKEIKIKRHLKHPLGFLETSTKLFCNFHETPWKLSKQL